MPWIMWEGAFGAIAAADARAVPQDFLFRAGARYCAGQGQSHCTLRFSATSVIRFSCAGSLCCKKSCGSALCLAAGVWLLWSVALQPLSLTLPAITTVLHELGWWLSHDERSLQRRDARGALRFFFFGLDGLGILQDWLPDRHRRVNVQVCGRLKHDYHRGRPHLLWACEHFPQCVLLLWDPRGIDCKRGC